MGDGEDTTRHFTHNRAERGDNVAGFAASGAAAAAAAVVPELVLRGSGVVRDGRVRVPPLQKERKKYNKKRQKRRSE